MTMMPVRGVGAHHAPDVGAVSCATPGVDRTHHGCDPLMRRVTPARPGPSHAQTPGDHWQADRSPGVTMTATISPPASESR
jgi:hypothetical protein